MKTSSASSFCVLVTGGAGYIGSHFVEVFLRDPSFQGCSLVILDNLSTGHEAFVEELKKTAALLNRKAPILEKVDLLEKEKVLSVFKKHQPQVVLHFAAKISVAESVENPELYFENNVTGSQNLLSAMKEVACKKIVFSSTAAVYGALVSSEPILESTRVAPINPYGETKLTMENEIRNAHSEWGLQSVIFRYFNASGASVHCALGEWHEPETHLIPLLLESVMVSDQKPLQVFGNDYPTRDGTCVRDYIHVTDLGIAHVLGLKRLMAEKITQPELFNLGTEVGTTVLEIIEATPKIVGKEVKWTLCPRRAGDAPVLVASHQKAKLQLGWIPTHSNLELILQSAWNWHRNCVK